MPFLLSILAVLTYGQAFLSVDWGSGFDPWNIRVTGSVCLVFMALGTVRNDLWKLDLHHAVYILGLYRLRYCLVWCRGGCDIKQS